MSQKMNVLYNKKPCYDILITKGFEELNNELSLFEISDKKLCIITE